MAEFLDQLSNEQRKQPKAHFLRGAASQLCSSSRMGANIENPKFSIPQPNALKLGAMQVGLNNWVLDMEEYLEGLNISITKREKITAFTQNLGPKLQEHWRALRRAVRNVTEDAILTIEAFLQWLAKFTLPGPTRADIAR